MRSLGQVRFARAEGRCEQCGRPHKQEIRPIPDGRWFDDEKDLWRDDQGGAAPWPDIIDYTTASAKKMMLAAAHLDHNPGNSNPQNLRALWTLRSGCRIDEGPLCATPGERKPR